MKNAAVRTHRSDGSVLGLELGSTRIKAAVIGEDFQPIASGSYTWKSDYTDGVWTYDLAEVWTGLRAALAVLDGQEKISAMGVSAMMHGYLAFDKDWKLLVPFRTWQNTMTAQAAEELTRRFSFNIPQRWSIAHLYQAMLNGEEHVSRIAHLTTLAGYVHHALTGEHVLGIGDASGMFPIDSAALDYDETMVRRFDDLAAEQGMSWRLRELLPRVLTAGEQAGTLTEAGASLLGGKIPAGIPVAPPEGDAGTGMTATNSVAPRTGNVSAGTSIFSMVVLERPLERVYPEIDLVTTPDGAPVAMVHCNNCTGDMNAWAELIREAVGLFGTDLAPNELYDRLYQWSTSGELDCGGVTVVNYLAGEGVTHFDGGRPLVVRPPESRLTLANFLRAQLYSTLATLRLGMDILSREQVAIDRLTGHGGLFKTPEVGQSYLAAACGVPVTCMEMAGEGGPYGMALLAAYLLRREQGETLSDFLSKRVFQTCSSTTLPPNQEIRAGFQAYLDRFRAALDVERTAVAAL